ncbi:MucR family transcriptional regulator [Methylocapsa palsarum]|nr:MucR family transcriptional regulator [Methylocapsa palsarum]
MHATLVKILSGAVTSDAPEPAAAAVSIRKSIAPDDLVCLDDGLKFKSLRRRLGALGMTPDEYRAKWKLPADYPIVAPNYATQRSEMAKRFELGQLRGDGVKRKDGRPRKETA